MRATVSSRRRERGAVFVVTLAILAALVAIVASVTVTERLATKEEANRLEQRRARATAEAGVQRAIAVLCDESSSGNVTNVNSGANSGSNVNQAGATTLQDDWGTLGSTGGDRFLLKGSSFRLQIVDAASRVNINTATQQQLQNLPLLAEQVDAILDWRSTGENARPDGAKDSYYNGLPNAYNASLAPFSSVSELLNVRYFTPADLFDAPQTQTFNPLPTFPDGRTPTLSELMTVDSVSPNVTRTGTAKTNLANVNIQQLARQGFFGPSAQQLFNARRNTTWSALIRAVPGMTTAQLRTLLNTYYLGSATGTGKINPNTASAAVLQTIPNLTSDIAQAILNQQSTGFSQLGDVLSVPGITSIRSAQNFIDYFGVKSQNFIVRVIGYAGYTQVPLEAVVSVTSTNGQNATAKILRMEEQPFNDMTGRWGWPSTTTSDVYLEAGS